MADAHLDPGVVMVDDGRQPLNRDLAVAQQLLHRRQIHLCVRACVRACVRPWRHAPRILIKHSTALLDGSIEGLMQN
jgi:hypothetical protein